MPDVNERLCCYFNENGKQCSCRMFTAPANKNARYHCHECMHGFSNHPEAQFSNKSPKLTMDVKVEPATGNRLLDVFRQRKTSRTMELPNSLQHVREEVLKGFRAGSSGTQRVTSTNIKKPNSTGKRVPSGNHDGSQQDVLVGTWLLLINALDEAGELIQTKPLSRTEMYTAEHQQCVHTGANAAKFAFRRDWTHDDVDKYLREHVFPRPMEYALMHKKGKSKASCCWKLAFKEKQRFGLAVTEDLPTGQDLFYYRGRFKCGTDSSIIIALCSHVPEEEYASWGPRKHQESSEFQPAKLRESSDSIPPAASSEDSEDKWTIFESVMRKQGHSQHPDQPKGKRGRYQSPVIEIESSTDSTQPPPSTQVPRIHGGSIRPSTLFLPSGDSDLLDVADLPTQLKGLSVSPPPPTFVGRAPLATANRYVSLPPRFLQDLDPFGSLVNSPLLHPHVNPWSPDYFLGAADYL
ncbi:hypothetical protein M404DRAFT_30482 [Pisolithus tinctorius Marx 270]|uniref:SET domain-containing protein n=1 Tax=Pisolithus tinctorius Marx 270 TaxID=870435 RepID=A0A0C3NEB0_PISTI|nr:hypothetical protein M404DRAFT_30482 [Pisolithus tinctorius Marx 270]